MESSLVNFSLPKLVNFRLPKSAYTYITLFCGKGDILEKFGVQNLFAGFWCDLETIGAWPWTEYQTPQPRLPAPPQVFDPASVEWKPPRELDLRREFETSKLSTEKTRVFCKFPIETRERIIDELNLPDENDIVVASMFDKDNYAVITYSEIIWKAGVSIGRLSIREAMQFNNVGGLVDGRYTNKWCYYEDGKIVVSDKPLLFSIKREQTIRHASPLVFLKDSSGIFHEFKIEPGPIVQTISAKIEMQRIYLKVRKPERDGL